MRKTGMTERELFQWMKTFIPGHLVRVENPLDPGTPDVNWCWREKESWIELKCANLSLQNTINLRHIRKEQIAWHNRRLASGGRVSIATAVCELKRPRDLHKHSPESVTIYFHRMPDLVTEEWSRRLNAIDIGFFRESSFFRLHEEDLKNPLEDKDLLDLIRKGEGK